VTLDERYVRMTELYAMTAQEQLTCGCHVHISVDSEEHRRPGRGRPQRRVAHAHGGV